MERSFFFDAVVTDGEPDRVYSASDVALERSAYFANGVLAPNALKVEANYGRTVRVLSGAAVIGGYTFISNAMKVIQIARASGMSRIDLVVLRLDLAARTMSVNVVTGTPGSQPAAPTPTTSGDVYEMALASVYMAADSDTILAEEVTDLRTFSRFLPGENAARVLADSAIADAIGSLDILDADEVDAAREVIGAVKTDGEDDEVLFGDGEYRRIPRLVRTELVRYTAAGNYTFNPTQYPSDGGVYDIELVGAGGAGGSSEGAYTRGGGGGAGAYVSAGHVRLSAGTGITVGAGGVGASGADGTDGGDTVVGTMRARGGHGGHADRTGGVGGESGAFFGNDGGEGCADVRSTAPMIAGKGASTVLGSGGTNHTMDVSCRGADATGNGAGGSGGGGISSVGSVTAGGNGAPGAVIIYGWMYEYTGVNG